MYFADMNIQLTDTVLMVAPTRFGFNEEAFQTNSFQNVPTSESDDNIQELARLEFDTFADTLKNKGVDVLVFEDHIASETPDSIFPNNWFSTHITGELITYPMAVSNRRKERREDIIFELSKTYGYHRVPFEQHEAQAAYLEGTGSLIFDHHNKTVYAAISPRTHVNVLKDVADQLGYRPIAFEAFGKTGEQIYHTNVMMCVGVSFIAIGIDTIAPADRERIESELLQSKKEIINLSNEQVYEHFSGNMLQIKNVQGERILVMSEKAFSSFSAEQIETFRRHTDHIVKARIPTIERIGGGSARCMLAEIFYV